MSSTAVTSRRGCTARGEGRPGRPKVLAFYLPQFHQIPENDVWWGTGFTDWVNVDRARPLYENHPQPVEPGELGRYDLSDPDVMRTQAALAAEHGVDGFVMHHYWFDGRPLLDTPLRNLLEDPTIDFPFAICWANENWTRRWDGQDSEVLIAQRYSDDWADRFYDDILPALGDPRYITRRRAAAARPLPRRAYRQRRCGDRTVEGARAGRRPRRPARPGCASFTAFRGAGATASRTSSTGSCGSLRWPASDSARSGTWPAGCPRHSKARSTPTTLQSIAPIPRRPTRVGCACTRA